ncbi:MAG TPA: flagellar basal body rod protein FlgB [Xanthobacteraceae bacterium]|nr:flagellar basal body rod protein FlgB [Xanthobacteraceae bacterium]
MISDIPIFSMLRTRMQWHQERQHVLSENVANADTPNFRPHDLAPPDFSRAGQPGTGALALARTNPAHLGSGLTQASFQTQAGRDSAIRPAGNAVNLEDEMMKVANNQMDYQAATALYTRGLGLLKTALGRR